MNSLIKKLRFKIQNPILVLNPPKEFKKISDEFKTVIHEQIKQQYDFIIMFAENIDSAKKFIDKILISFTGDGHLWFCYPKGTSKEYKSDINRSIAWKIFAPYDFEAVTSVSIDEDWTALRFKNVDKIKTMKRKTASSEKGKLRIKKK